MKILSIELDKYVPLLHGGINKLEIEITQQVICCIGQNGSGKSSVLRELTVYPPTSTDYERGGGKKIVVEHNGLKYELESRFDGHKGIHSFIMDGEELNDARNSTTQISLCEAHFGVTSLIKGITSGEVTMSTLSRIERKNLLAACYPSDMTFILRYHQKISSKIRALKANIKMMHNRQLELTDAMISEQEFARLQTLTSQLNEFRMEIDKWLHTFDRELNEWKQRPEYTSRLYENNDLNEDEIHQNIRKLLSTHATLLRDRPTISNGVLSDDIATTSISIKLRKDTMEDVNNETQKLAKEINEYEELADRNLDEELNDLEQEIKSLSCQIKALPIDPKIPVISPREIGTFDLNRLENTLLHIHSAQCPVISSVEYKSRKDELTSLRQKASSINQDMMKLLDVLDKLHTKHARIVGSAYNPNCALPCQLKDNYNQSINDLKDEIDQCDSSIKKLEQEKMTVIEMVDKLSDSLANQTEYIESVRWIERFVDIAPEIDYILNGRDLIETINMIPMELHNRTSRLVANAMATHEKRALDESLSTAVYKQRVLLESKLPAKELISKSLIEKKAKLKELGDKYSEYVKSVYQMEAELSALQTLSNIQEIASGMRSEYVTKANFHRIRMKIEQLTEMSNDLRRYRMLADEKQNEIKGVVRAQEHHRIRLNEEVIPSLEKLTLELTQLETVEVALSPSTGLPHVYMVRFLNGCINTVNDYIRAVWNKDMVVMNLKESDTLDFTFPVEHNRTSVVKDISICSRGEQEIINLAWTLALCSHMQLGLRYPIRSDECDSGMTPGHRQKLLTLLSTLVRQGDIKQLFIVNHFSALHTAFANSQTICLNPDGISVPAEYNENVTIS